MIALSFLNHSFPPKTPNPNIPLRKMVLLSYLVAASCVIVVVLAVRVLNWVWFRPKKLEKILRKQGFNGNSYRLFYGDMKEMVGMFKEAMSKPIKLDGDIVPRAQPFFAKTVEKYGMFFTKYLLCKFYCL